MAPPNTLTIPAGAPHLHNATLIASAAQSTTGSNQSTPVKGAGRYSSASIMLDVTAITASTVNVWVQKLLPDGSTWMDIAAFDQLTAAGDRVIEIVAAGNAQHTPTDGALTAGTILTTNLGNQWAVAWSVGNSGGGTATFAVYADFHE